MYVSEDEFTNSGFVILQFPVRGNCLYVVAFYQTYIYVFIARLPYTKFISTTKTWFTSHNYWYDNHKSPFWSLLLVSPQVLPKLNFFYSLRWLKIVCPKLDARPYMGKPCIRMLKPQIFTLFFGGVCVCVFPSTVIITIVKLAIYVTILHNSCNFSLYWKVGDQWHCDQDQFMV